jgi:osmoprotectant transport system substrate-binding protein
VESGGYFRETVFLTINTGGIKMFRKLKAAAAMTVAVLILALAGHAHACVGKSLVVGSVNTPSASTVSEMLGILITERTGTTVVIKYFDNFASLSEAIKKGEVDIMVDYTGRCYIDVLGLAPDPDAARVFSRVKEVYQRDMNLVWLEPFGYSEPGTVSGKGGATPAMAAPVVRKETLGKFPALPRVIKKLAGRLDNGVVARLASEGTGGKTKKVTRKYLKDNKLI